MDVDVIFAINHSIFRKKRWAAATVEAGSLSAASRSGIPLASVSRSMLGLPTWGMTRVLSDQIVAVLQSGVHTGQGRLPVKLRAFLDFAAPRLRERLAQASW